MKEIEGGKQPHIENAYVATEPIKSSHEKLTLPYRDTATITETEKASRRSHTRYNYWFDLRCYSAVWLYGRKHALR